MVGLVSKLSSMQDWLLDQFLLMWKRQGGGGGGEGSMLNFSDALVLRSLFSCSCIAMTEESVSVTLCEGAEYPYVKKYAVPISSPEVVCCNIHPGVLRPHYLLF